MRTIGKIGKYIIIAVLLALSFSLVTAVPAAAEEELNVYSYGSELYVADGSTDWAEINISVDIALGDIDELEFREYIDSYNPNGYSVSVLLGIDANGDSVFEADVAGWHVGPDAWTLTALNGDTFVEMDGASANPTKGVWTSTNALSVAQWWTPDESGAGFAESDEYPWTFYGSFADFINVFIPSATQTSLIPDTAARVLCVKLLIGGSGSWMDETAYVDEVTVNGETYYLTIQRAVDSATGTIINVADGTYTEEVLVNVEGITIKGESLDAIVDGGFDLKADNITIDGLTIKNGGFGTKPRGIFTRAETGPILGSKGHKIINNELIGPGDTTGWGINIVARDEEPVNILVDNNKMHGWRIAVFLEGYNNAITRNKLCDNTKAGIGVERSCNNLIRNNDICKNGQYGIDFVSEPDTGNEVTCNNIWGNGEYGIRNVSPGEVDAEYNWWGHYNGPSGQGWGSGDAVSDKVDFVPWLSGLWQVTPPCGTPPPPPTPPSEHGAAVGIEVYSVDKIGLIAPWIALAVVVIAGGVVLLIRRRAHSKN